MSNISKKDSQAIVVIRYPLIVLVVMIHCFYGELNNDFYQLPGFKFLTYDLLPKITVAAVPTFFFISGYLFFKGNDFCKSTYIEKLKRRVKTLLLPFLFWNFIIIAALFLVQIYKPEFQPLIRMHISDFSLPDFLACFYDTKYINSMNAGGPINFPLWFLSDLIFLSIITPIIYLFVKRKILGAVFILAIPALDYIIPKTGFYQNINLIYFSLGAYISQNCNSIASLCNGMKFLIFIAIYIVSLITERVFGSIQIISQFSTIINIISLTLIFFSIAEKFSYTSKSNIVKLFSRSTYFVYCSHIFGLGIMYEIIKRGIFYPTSDAASIVFFFIAVAIISLFGTALYCLKEKIKGTFSFLR